MTKLGFNADMRDVCAFKSECFMIIAGKLAELEKEAMKKKPGK